MKKISTVTKNGKKIFQRAQADHRFRFGRPR